MSRIRSLVLSALLMAFAGLPAVAHAGHVELPAELREELVLPEQFQDAGGESDVHSDNMHLLANFDDDGTYREGTDLAFWRKTAVAGAYNKLRVFDIKRPDKLREVGELECLGSQNDVSVWKDLAFMSVDSPRQGPGCDAASGTAEAVGGSAWEGIRIVSIADRSEPKQIATVKTDCGSHTHTLVPDRENDRVLIYALSYPTTPGSDCNGARHRRSRLSRCR